MRKLKTYLIDHLGYEPFEVELILEDFESADQESRDAIIHIIDGDDVSSYSCGDYSVSFLMNNKGFNAICAVLAISNLKKDYEKYSALYSRPIK